MPSRTFLTAMLLLVTLAVPTQGLPQMLPSAELKAAHQRLIDDPRNLDNLYAYAQLAIDQGNFEAAISALEGMLVIARNQPRVLLELGMLYQRLGAPRVAESYLRRAKALGAADGTLAGFADEFLGAAEDEIAPDRWSGFVQLGVRYQSNPTLAPEAAEIYSHGVRVPRPEARRVESDSNAMLLGRIANRHALTGRSALDSDLILFATAYGEQSQLDYGMLELTSGIRFESPKNAAGQYSFRPHVLLRGSRLDGASFERTAGAGLDFKLDIGANALFEATYQYRNLGFEDFNGNGTAPLRDGDEHRLILSYRNEFRRGHVISLRLFGTTRSAERAFFEEDMAEITLRYSLRFTNFLFDGRPGMTLTPYVSRRIREFGDPDPGIDPATSRSDRWWRAGLTWRVPVERTWSVFLNLERAEIDSNIVNFDATNNLFMVGLQKGF